MNVIKQAVCVLPQLRSGSWILSVPASKSITNRVIHLAALAEGESVILNPLDAEDTRHMVQAWRSLGVRCEWSDGQIKMRGCAGAVLAREADLFVGNAGTVARFVLAALLLGKGRYRLFAEARMYERPMAVLLDALGLLGLKCHYLKQANCLPIVVEPSESSGVNTLALDCNESSQFLSAILMVMPYLSSLNEIEASNQLVSQPYVRMTCQLMAQFGAEIKEVQGRRFTVTSKKSYQGAVIEVEPDASSASYFFTLAAISHSTVTIKGLKPTSLQGDLKYLVVLEQMGCQVTWSVTGVTLQGPNVLRSVDVDMNEMTDVVPSLAIAALFAKGTTSIRRIAHMQHKECRRIDVLCSELKKTGAILFQLEGGLSIKGQVPLTAARCETYRDHRMAMAFSILGTQIPGLEVVNPACVQKTFPCFYETLLACAADG